MTLKQPAWHRAQNRMTLKWTLCDRAEGCLTLK